MYFSYMPFTRSALDGVLRRVRFRKNVSSLSSSVVGHWTLTASLLQFFFFSSHVIRHAMSFHCKSNTSNTHNERYLWWTWKTARHATHLSHIYEKLWKITKNIYKEKISCLVMFHINQCWEMSKYILGLYAEATWNIF